MGKWDPGGTAQKLFRRGYYTFEKGAI